MHHPTELHTSVKQETPLSVVDGVSDSPVDYDLPFEMAVEQIRSVKGKPIKHGSGNYWVLFALWKGEVIDDYFNRPTDNQGRPVQNVKSRVSDLTNNFMISIDRKRVRGENYKEYWIEERR